MGELDRNIKAKVADFPWNRHTCKSYQDYEVVFDEVENFFSQKASFLSVFLFDKLGFVSDSLISYVPKWIQRKCEDKLFIQPLGVDYKLFISTSKAESLERLGLDNYKYALFSDISGTPIKRRDIAEAIVNKLGGDYRLLIMSKVKPEMVPVYLNACDFVLLTSDEEGSPNITREALSLNKRVFSVDVGDVKQQLKGLKNSAIISRDPDEAARVMLQKLAEPYTDNTRESLRGKIDFEKIGSKMVDIYEGLLK